MSNNQITQLDADQKEVSVTILKDTYFAVKQLHGLIANDKLTEEMKETIPQLIEYKMSEISKIIGFDSISAKKVEEKHAEIREANQTIRKLEEKLGSDKSSKG